jgi:hypothetical protein
MIDSLLLTMTLMSGNDRAVSLEQPSRGSHASVIREAAKVPAKHRSFASCVLDRESGGTLDRIQSGVGAKNPNSTASGRWQFLDSQWREGLSFMVRDRLVQFGMPNDDARTIRQQLSTQPIYEWHGYWQQIGFVEVITRGGEQHWKGHGC